MKNKLIALSAVATVMATSAQAVILTPNTFTPLPGTTLAARPELAGTVQATLTQNFSITTGTGLITGSVESSVLKETVSGTLDFYWRVSVNATSVASVQDFRLINFFTGVYDGDWRSDGIGVVDPSRALLFAPALGAVNFNFRHSQPAGVSYLSPGENSRLFFLHTNATVYGLTAQYDIANVGQSSSSNLVSTYAPGAVPEPAPIALLLGLGGVALLRRRR